MTPRAPGTNHPPRKREAEALKRRTALVKKYIGEGLTIEKAEARAQKEMRDNPTVDWRKG